MKKFLLFSTLLLISINVFSQNATTSPPIDWNGLYLTFAATLAAVPAITELVKRIIGQFVKLSGIANQIISWVMGLIVVLTGWSFGLGWLNGLTWYEMIAYAIIASLASNGVFDFVSNLSKK